MKVASLQQPFVAPNQSSFRGGYTGIVKNPLCSLDERFMAEPHLKNLRIYLKQFLVFHPEVQETRTCINFLDQINMYQAKVLKAEELNEMLVSKDFLYENGKCNSNNKMINFYDVVKDYRIGGLLMQSLPRNTKRSDLVVRYKDYDLCVTLKTKKNDLIFVKYILKKYTNSSKKVLDVIDSYFYKPSDKGNLIEIHTKHDKNNHVLLDQPDTRNKSEFIDEIKGHIIPCSNAPVEKNDGDNKISYFVVNKYRTDQPVKIIQKNSNGKECATIKFNKYFGVKEIDFKNHGERFIVQFDMKGMPSEITLLKEKEIKAENDKYKSLYYATYYNDVLLMATGEIYDNWVKSFSTYEGNAINLSTYIVDKITRDVGTPSLTKNGLVWEHAPFNMSKFAKQQENLFKFIWEKFPEFSKKIPETKPQTDLPDLLI